MITIQYTCKTDEISAARIDTTRILTARTNEFEMPSLVTEGVHEYSFTGSAKRTTVHGEYEKGRIGVPYIDSATYPAWREFFLSVRRGEVFTIDATSLSWVNREITAFIPDTQLDISQFNLWNGHKVSFNYRVINN